MKKRKREEEETVSLYFSLFVLFNIYFIVVKISKRMRLNGFGNCKG